jgi:hypothetical protein
MIQSRSTDMEVDVATLVCLWHMYAKHNPDMCLLPHLIPAKCMPSAYSSPDGVSRVKG